MDEKIFAGGIFFSVVMECKKGRLSNSKGISELARLMYAKDSKEKINATTHDASDYKRCKSEGGGSLPFNNDGLKEGFLKRLKENYSEALELSESFVHNHFDAENNSRKFVNIVLELIKDDDTIEDGALFYVQKTGEPLDKKSLLKINKVYIPAFLLGIWGYIITSDRKNSDGDKSYIYRTNDADEHNQRLLKKELGKKYDFQYELDEEKNDQIVENIKETIDINEESNIPPGMIAFFNTFLERLKGDGDAVGAYLKGAKKKYDIARTMLSQESTFGFYDLYVASDLSYTLTYRGKMKRKQGETVIIDQPSAQKIFEQFHNCAMICGTGGQGKSMMMTHFLLQAIEDFDRDKTIPIFIRLRDFYDNVPDIEEYSYECFKNLGGNLERDDYHTLLVNGRILLLLDGVDELPENRLIVFTKQVETLLDKYNQLKCIMSSRLFGAFNHLRVNNRFDLYQLELLGKEKVKEVVEKLYKNNVLDGTVRDMFISDLDKRLFYTHAQFVSNPLLLTIMLMTYEQFGAVPKKRYLFYQEAYLALAYRHDMFKENSRRRELRTSLTTERYADYFSEFSARTYLSDKYEFTEGECENVYRELNCKKKDGCKAEIVDFLHDAVTSLCLMIYEGGKYYFVHRSFQEYFCALFYSRFKDKKLWNVGQAFEKKGTRMSGDKAFDMLYEMIPEKVEEFIIIPYIESLQEYGSDDDNYMEFLQNIYRSYEFGIGDCPDCDNIPTSFLYNFIVNKYELGDMEYGGYGEILTELSNDFLQEEYYVINKNYNSRTEDEDIHIVDKSDIPADYERIMGEPEVSGWIYEVDFSVLFNPSNKEKYAKTIRDVMSHCFCLREEFDKVKDKGEELKRKVSESYGDIFDTD